jgi:large subunit ribosomal protein L21
MKYAVIKTGGKQYRVAEGETLQVEKLNVEKGEVTFSEVLLMVDGEKVELGTPTLEGVNVYANVVAEVKGDKIEVFKYKSKSRYRKHTGHRQQYSQITITGIGGKPTKAAAPKAEKPAKAAKPAAKKAPAKKAPVKKAAK